MVGAPDNSNSVFNNADNLVYYPGGGNSGDGTPTTTTSNGGNSTPGVTQSGVGGWLQGVGQFLTGSNNGFTNAAFIPAMAQAYQQWRNADTYKQLGQDAADRSDPFGKYRGYYGDKLRGLYDDPSSIANTPGYKFALNQTLDATQGRLASMGYGGTGTMADSLSAEASGLAQQTFNQERNALMQMAGAQFDPANAGRMMMEGGRLSVDAKNAALAAMFYPFGPGAAGNTVNVNGSGNGSGQNGGAGNLQNRLMSAVSSGKISAADAASLFQRVLNSQGNISDGDLNLMNSLGIDTNVDLGGVDTAPGSYPVNPFGGYGDVNTSTQSIFDSQNGSPFDIANAYGAGYNTPDIVTDPSGIDMSGFQVNPWG